MKQKNTQYSLEKIASKIFITVVFCTPFISYPFILNSLKIGKELYIISAVSIGLIICSIKLLSSKQLNFNKTDLLFFLLVLYSLLNFYFNSYFGFMYNTLWVFLSYILLYYLFKFIYRGSNYKSLIEYTVLLFWVFSIVESVIAVLQFFSILKVENEFFKTLGTFINPNFLSIYLVIGFISTLYLFKYYSLKKKWFKGLLIASSILLLTVLFLTESRASWLALIVGLITFFTVSKKNIEYLKLNKSKAIISSFGIFTILLGAMFLLSKMNQDSVSGRYLINKITYSKIKEKPIVGHGLFNFTGDYNRSKAAYFLNETRNWEEIKVANYVSIAFNDYLHLWFEIGLIGLLLFVLILLFSFKETIVNPHTKLAIAITIAFLFLGFFTSVIYNPTIMLIAIWALSILNITKISSVRTYSIRNSMVTKSFFTMLFLVGCSIVFLSFKKTSTLINFKQALDSREKIAKYIDKKDIKFIKEHSYIEFNYGMEIYNNGEREKGLLLMQNSIKKSSLPKARIALAQIYRREKRDQEIEELLKLNVGVEPFRYKPRNDLLNYYMQNNFKEKQLKLAKEIVALPIKIESPEISMYKSIAQTTIDKHHLEKTKHKLVGNLSEPIIYNSEFLEQKIQYRIYKPKIETSTQDVQIIYINDGQDYIGQEVHKKLDSLIIHKVIHPVIAVFIDTRNPDNLSQNRRQEYFLCNKKFEDFFIKELIPNVEEDYLKHDFSNNRTIMGLSFGGLVSASLANNYPKHFKNVIMQSPSFYPCPEIFSEYYNNPKRDFNIYISYGTGNDTQGQALALIELLERKKYNYTVNVVDKGNHDWNLWKNELDAIFSSFFSF